MRTTLSQGQRPIIFTAALSIAGLLAAIGFQLGAGRESDESNSVVFERPHETTTTRLTGERDWKTELIRLGIVASTTAPADESATTTDPLFSIGDVIAQETVDGYLSLKKGGTYTKESANKLGNYIGTNIAPSPTNIPHTKIDITRDPDISEARVLHYRSDMREALAPLISDAPPEFETFAYYVETKNPARLDDLRAAAARYKAAEKNMLAVSVPENAVALHLRAMNALGAYANTLDRLVLFADSSLASLALLRTYNETEREMLYAFDALAEYYVHAVTQ